MSQGTKVRPLLLPLLPYLVKGFDADTGKPVVGFPYVMGKEVKHGVAMLNCILEFSLEDGEIPAEIAEEYTLCIPAAEFHVVKKFYKFLFIGPDGLAYFEDEKNGTGWN